MAKGIDIGTMNIICSEKEDGDVVFTQERNAFLELESSDLTKAMLDNAQVLYIERDNVVYVLGEDAFKFATIFGKTARRPMKSGIISPNEKDAIPTIKLILERVLGEPRYRNEVLCISTPADPIDLNMNSLYHKKMMEALARKMDYKTHVIDESLGVVYSELSEYNFTGLGISMGAGLTNVTLAYLATPVMSFSIGRGGDWIDEQVSITTGLPKDDVCAAKERGFKMGLEVEYGSTDGALTIYYDALVTYIIKNINKKLAEITPPKVEFPVAIAGGSALPVGLPEMFEQKLREAKLQIDISNIKRAKEPMYSVAKGCLIAARAQEGEEIWREGETEESIE